MEKNITKNLLLQILETTDLNIKPREGRSALPQHNAASHLSLGLLSCADHQSSLPVIKPDPSPTTQDKISK